jgi:hypothetical protein
MEIEPACQSARPRGLSDDGGINLQLYNHADEGDFELYIHKLKNMKEIHHPKHLLRGMFWSHSHH